MLYDVGTGEEAARSAPLHPAEMAALLKQKKFTSPKADRPLVIGLYHATILSVLGGAEELQFSDSGWGPRDGVAFAKLLPFARGSASGCYCQNMKAVTSEQDHTRMAPNGAWN